jgi:hypothetical protein
VFFVRYVVFLAVGISSTDHFALTCFCMRPVHQRDFITGSPKQYNQITQTNEDYCSNRLLVSAALRMRLPIPRKTALDPTNEISVILFAYITKRMRYKCSEVKNLCSGFLLFCLPLMWEEIV